MPWQLKIVLSWRFPKAKQSVKMPFGLKETVSTQQKQSILLSFSKFKLKNSKRTLAKSLDLLHNNSKQDVNSWSKEEKTLSIRMNIIALTLTQRSPSRFRESGTLSNLESIRIQKTFNLITRWRWTISGMNTWRNTASKKQCSSTKSSKNRFKVRNRSFFHQWRVKNSAFSRWPRQHFFSYPKIKLRIWISHYTRTKMIWLN
jgi:hypothetical protein